MNPNDGCGRTLEQGIIETLANEYAKAIGSCRKLEIENLENFGIDFPENSKIKNPENSEIDFSENPKTGKSENFGIEKSENQGGIQ